MTNDKASHFALAEDLCLRATIPFTAQTALKFAHAVVVWNERAKARRILRAMEPHRRDDIGLSYQEIYLEARKPFWRG